MSPGILPCEIDTGHPFNMCWTVGHGLSQRGHLASGLSLHCRKFKEVGSVSDPALSRNDSCLRRHSLLDMPPDIVTGL